MSRMYIVNHWNDAAAYSGEQIGERLKDSTALHFNRDGSANVNLYSEETALAKKKSSVSITDRILPQKRRVDSLTAQMVELESEYKAGKMSIQDYSLYRDIVSAKRDRTIVLLDRARKVKPIRSETDEDSVEYTPSSGFSPSPNDGYASEEYEEIRVVWIDSLSSNNSFKKPLKIACTLIKTAVHWSHKARSYWNELKAV